MIDLEITDGVAFITLNAPATRNALNNELAGQFVAACDEADRDHVAAADFAQLMECEEGARDGDDAEECGGCDHPKQRSAQPRLGQRRHFLGRHVAPTHAASIGRGAVRCHPARLTGGDPPI